MPTNFPTSIDSFSTKTNSVDTIAAAHVNNLQDSTVAIEQLLGADSRRRTAFTPTFTFSTTAPTSITYDTNLTQGYYARFGSIVFFGLVLSVTAYSGGSGSLWVNMPDAVFNAAGNNFGSIRAVSGFTTNWPTLWASLSNASRCEIFAAGPSAAATAVTQANVSTSGFQLRMGGHFWHG